MGKAALSALGIIASIVGAGTAQAAQSSHVSFITCPIFRNSGSTRCWLAEREGVTYFIGRHAGSAPQLLHKVLIQGTVSTEPPSCGGVILSPLYISVLQEIDHSCNSVLPDNGARPTGRQFYDLPTAEQLLIDEPLPMPKGPFKSQKFVGRFDHDSHFLNMGMQQVVETAANYAVASKASQVRVTGRVGNSKLDDGRILVERPSLAKVRAEAVASALIGLGVDPKRVDVSWVEKSPAPDGIGDADLRAVEIELTVPGSS